MNARALFVLAAVLIVAALSASVMEFRQSPPVSPIVVAPLLTPQASPITPSVAISLRLPLLAAEGGALQPNDHVDVVGLFPPQGQTPASTRVLAPNALVVQSTIDVDQVSIGLSVTREQAVLLQQSEQLSAREFVILRSGKGSTASGDSFSDADLLNKLSQIATSKDASGGSR